ncbi:hypothetical protein DFH29DRAFT_1000548 [Suillus ampliporus]|nr:hypothetical protein DFH29DRAFT_1000548 [Suillus ampliporus]
MRPHDFDITFTEGKCSALEIRAKKETLLSFVQPLVDKGTWFTSANGIIQTGIATIIVLEYSAFLQCDRELKFIKSAVDYYMKSPTVVAVEKVAREIADGNYKKEERKKKILEFVLENRLCTSLALS